MGLRALFRQARTGRYQAGDTARVDCVVGFSFGAVRGARGFEPGESNVALARFALAHLGGVPWLLQREIADAATALDPGCPAPVRIGDHRPQDHPPDTRAVAVAAWEVMRRNGWKAAAVLAHPHHAPRAAAVCRRLGMRPALPEGLDEVGFCPDSVQPWTRDERAWFRREALVIPYYLLRGWI